MARRRYKAGGGRFVALRHYMLDSAAWCDLDPVSQSLYVALARRYMGQNNGKIPYSVREGAEKFHVSKATISRSFRRLIDHGFIAITQKGHFDYKVRHATEWRLTEFACGNELVGTKDFMRWELSGGSLATAPCGARFASRPVPLKRVPPGKLEVSLS